MDGDRHAALLNGLLARPSRVLDAARLGQLIEEVRLQVAHERAGPLKVVPQGENEM
jgi:hypothetical protein